MWFKSLVYCLKKGGGIYRLQGVWKHRKIVTISWFNKVILFLVLLCLYTVRHIMHYFFIEQSVDIWLHSMTCLAFLTGPRILHIQKCEKFCCYLLKSVSLACFCPRMFTFWPKHVEMNRKLEWCQKKMLLSFKMSTSDIL